MAEVSVRRMIEAARRCRVRSPCALGPTGSSAGRLGVAIGKMHRMCIDKTGFRAII